MIKYIYASKNKLSGNFNVPMFEDFEPEGAAERYSIAAVEHSSEAVKELEMYFLGTFDTKTGVLVSSIDYLVDLGVVINGRETQDSK